MIQAILFDLGNVLVPVDFDSSYRAAAERCGLAPHEVEERLRLSGLADVYERGRMSSAEFHRQVDAMFGLGCDLESFRAVWGAMLQGEPLVEESLLDQLRPGVRTAILSNTNELHWDWVVERYPLVRRFKTAVLSHEVGAMKPEAAIYEAALEAVGARAEQCFFTDDRPENIEGARALGIQAELFAGARPLRDRLQRLGLLRG